MSMAYFTLPASPSKVASSGVTNISTVPDASTQDVDSASADKDCTADGKHADSSKDDRGSPTEVAASLSVGATPDEAAGPRRRTSSKTSALAAAGVAAGHITTETGVRGSVKVITDSAKLSAPESLPVLTWALAAKFFLLFTANMLTFFVSKGVQDWTGTYGAVTAILAAIATAALTCLDLTMQAAT
jgi:hypothetical protein